MSTKRIILISGFARSGKDTLANGLVKEFAKADKEAVVTKFAIALKRALQLALNDVGLGHIDVFTEDTAEKEILRPLLVEFGKYCRAKDKNVFVNRTLKDVDAMLKQGKDAVVISDCRYLNEAKLVRAYGANELVEVDRFHIERRNNKAANDEEANSIAHMNVNDTDARFAGFEEGMVHQIEWWAEHIVQNKLVTLTHGGIIIGNHEYAEPNKGTAKWTGTLHDPNGQPVFVNKVDNPQLFGHTHDPKPAPVEQSLKALWDESLCLDESIDRVSKRVDAIDDQLMGIKLLLERIDARLKRLEVGRG